MTGGGGRRIQPLQPFGGEDGGGVHLASPTEPPPSSAADNATRQNKSLARCYDQALKAYRAGRNSMGLIGTGLDQIKQISPLSFSGGLNSLSGGFVGVATRGMIDQGRHLFVENAATAFGKGFFRGGLGAGATRFGMTSRVGKFAGGIGAGFALGGLFVQGFDAFAGPEAFLRQAIRECNNAHPGAIGQVGPTIYQFPTSNADAAQAYIDANQ